MFIRKDDGNLSYVAGTPTQRKGHMQGLPARGESTKDWKGAPSLLFIDKKQVSDVLDDGRLLRQANVAGSIVYCR